MAKKIICYGESLWDLLPSGKVAGGAPMNVAFHLQNFGSDVTMISRVGTDGRGNELIQFLDQKGLKTHCIQRDAEHPTGVVEVTLDEKGSPSYEIIKNVAWDHIAAEEQVLDLVKDADALVFGSLACRNYRSQKTLFKLIEACSGLKIFDLNLRKPFYNRHLINDLMRKSDITKMNDEELDLVAAWYLNSKNPKVQMAELIDFVDLQLMILTAGSKGAYCHDGEEVHFQEAFPVTVKDTIGSGDSFFAAFIHHYLAEAPAQDCLKYACATGALVATKQGGTPNLDQQMVDQFIANP
ncbi:MAG: carbohydrate kinase [Bacteroidota bacterium]